MTFRSDEDAARVRVNELEAELAFEQSRATNLRAELEVVRAERVQLEAAARDADRWRPKWYETQTVAHLVVALLVLSAIALVFSVLYFPSVLVGGRW